MAFGFTREPIWGMALNSELGAWRVLLGASPIELGAQISLSCNHPYLEHALGSGLGARGNLLDAWLFGLDCLGFGAVCRFLRIARRDRSLDVDVICLLNAPMWLAGRARTLTIDLAGGFLYPLERECGSLRQGLGSLHDFDPGVRPR